MAASQISAERAVENLMAEYSHLADDGEFAELGRLFADGVFVIGGKELSGKEVEEFSTQTVIFHDGTPGTRHVTTNIKIEIEGDKARARSYFTVFQSLPDFPLQPVIGGQYRDTFHVVDGQWRFERREVLTDMFGDVSRVVNDLGAVS